MLTTFNPLIHSYNKNMATNKKQIKKSTVYAFIDSQNLNLGIHASKWELDFKKFRLYLKNKYNVTEAFLFIGHMAGNESLYTYLQKSGYIVVFKPTLEIKKREKTIVKGNVDAELVLHTMIELDNFNKAIIITGDGDFHCLIEYLEKQNKLLRILVPNQNYSSLLRKFQDYIVRVDLLKNKLKADKRKTTKISGRSKP